MKMSSLVHRTAGKLAYTHLRDWLPYAYCILVVSLITALGTWFSTRPDALDLEVWLSSSAGFVLLGVLTNLFMRSRA